MTRLAATLLGLLALAAPALADTLTPQRQREILDAALTAYDHAVSAARQDPARSAELYRQSAAGFEALLAAGVRNAPLEYNLGNAYYRLGDSGRAILHYRRAERLAPRDARIAANLRFVRERVEPAITASGESQLVASLLFWHVQTSVWQRFVALVALAAAGWTLLVFWLGTRRRGLAWAGAVAVLLACVAGASLHWQLEDAAAGRDAVVIDARPHLRLGRGDGADLALQQALGPGVEVRILQERGEWLEVRLAGGQVGWLPTTSVQRISCRREPRSRGARSPIRAPRPIRARRPISARSASGVLGRSGDCVRWPAACQASP
jgi:tetratricopeptide (TPR) repeat protein